MRGGFMVAGWAMVVGRGLGCGLSWLRFLCWLRGGLVAGWAGCGMGLVVWWGG